MIKLIGIEKEYRIGDTPFKALTNVSLSLPDKGMVFITGKSGSGKSTLLSILGGILSPSRGEYLFDGVPLGVPGKKGNEGFLREKVSFVFQDYNLLNDFTVRGNLSLAGAEKNDEDQILSAVGLLEKESTPVRMLSGGEKQRLAIGRALAKKSRAILLDEPTGNLDEANSREVMSLLRGISKEKLIVAVTHDLSLVAEYGDTCVSLSDGKVTSLENVAGKKFDVAVGEKVSDSVIEVLSYPSFLDAERITISSKSGERTVSMPDEGKGDFLMSELKKSGGPVASVSIIRKPLKEKKMPSKDGVPRFGAKKRLKYSLNLLKKKPGRAFSSAVVMALSFGLLLVHGSFLFFDQGSALENAFRSSDLNMSPAYKIEENENLHETGTYRTGMRMASEISSSFEGSFPFVSGTLADKGLNVYLVGIDRPVSFKGFSVDVPGDGEMVCTSFLSSLNGGVDVASLEFSKEMWSASAEFRLSRVLDVGYPSSDMADFLSNQESQYTNKDKFVTSYAMAFTSGASLTQLVSSSPCIRVRGGNFAFSSLQTKDYFDVSCRYSGYQGQDLSFGSSPKGGIEAVVSSTFASRFLLEQNDNMEDCLGREYSFKDLNASPNHVIYQGYPNMYDVSNGLKVVGISPDENADVFLNAGMFGRLVQAVGKCPDGYECYSESPSSLAKGFSDSGLYSSLSLASPIYSIGSAVSSALSYALFGVGAALFALSVISLSLTCLLNIKEKTKEIAIMKSMGIGSGSISGIFIDENTFLTILSLALGMALSASGIAGINATFMNPDVFGINYGLLTIRPISVLIIVAIGILGSLVSTLFPIRSADKIDIATALKN